MRLEIRGRHVQITETIRAYVERRLGFALDRFAEQIRIVKLKVGDANSSEGSVDKRCQLAISLTHSSPIILESCGSSVQRAIDCISSKIGALVARRFSRKRQRRRFSKHVRQLSESPSISAGSLLRRGATL